jgi:hypothetical protein
MSPLVGGVSIRVRELGRAEGIHLLLGHICRAELAGRLIPGHQANFELTLTSIDSAPVSMLSSSCLGSVKSVISLEALQTVETKASAAEHVPQPPSPHTVMVILLFGSIGEAWKRCGVATVEIGTAVQRDRCGGTANGARRSSESKRMADGIRWRRWAVERIL